MQPAAWYLTHLESGLLVTSLSVYAGASVIGVNVLRGLRRGRALRPLLALGVIALTLLLAAITVRGGHVPVMRRFEVVVAAAWLIAIGGWLIDRRARLPALAAGSAPGLALLTLFAILLVPDESGRPPAAAAGTVVHIVLATLGFAAFTVAAATGMLYLWQIRVLKRDPAAAVARRLPPLQRLDRLNFIAASIGFPLLALSVAAGWLFLATSPEQAVRWWLDPTVLVTLGGLLVYLVLFLARALLGWYGRRIAWLTVIGFFVAVVGFVVAKFCTGSNLLHTQ